MSGRAKSQWDFGELFPPETLRKVLTISELTFQVKRLLEQQVGRVWVTGEVTNFRAQSSGHFYFTLKDADCQLACVLFRNEARSTRELVQDGRKLVIQGELTVYEPRGQYQLRVTEVEVQGAGALQLAFEKLKQKLNAEGLFAPERKRPLPRYAQRIGLITSPTGAAIRDVLHVIQRRNPALEIVLAPCRVQGQGAAEEIAQAIALLNQWSARQAEAPLDLILVTRGGGSLEDLWAFNEEVVARAIHASVLPVVSAVGHEIDFTISDFVADFRAATPSAAAEIISEGIFASREFVLSATERLREVCREQLELKAREMELLTQRLSRVRPRRRLEEHLQRLDDLQGSLVRCARHHTRQSRLVWQNLFARLARARPRQLLERKHEAVIVAERRLRELSLSRVQTLRHRFESAYARLRLLGPEQVLARGYSITLDPETGKVIRAAEGTQPGRTIITKLESGELSSVVQSRSVSEGITAPPGQRPK